MEYMLIYMIQLLIFWIYVVFIKKKIIKVKDVGVGVGEDGFLLLSGIIKMFF